MRSIRAQKEWNVETQTPGGTPSASIRSRISPAALLVKVIARMSSGRQPEATRCATRRVMTRVFPLPGPASTSSGPARC